MSWLKLSSALWILARIPVGGSLVIFTADSSMPLFQSHGNMIQSGVAKNFMRALREDFLESNATRLFSSSNFVTLLKRLAFTNVQLQVPSPKRKYRNNETSKFINDIRKCVSKRRAVTDLFLIENESNSI